MRYLVLRLFVIMILGQCYSEDRVFAWVQRLIFAWTPSHVYGTNPVPTLGPIPAPHTFRSSFERNTKSRVWPIRHRAHFNP